MPETPDRHLPQRTVSTAERHDRLRQSKILSGVPPSLAGATARPVGLTCAKLT